MTSPEQRAANLAQFGRNGRTDEELYADAVANFKRPDLSDGRPIWEHIVPVTDPRSHEIFAGKAGVAPSGSDAPAIVASVSTPS